MADAKVNGRRTSWADLSFDCGYGDVIGLQSIDWSESREKVSRYGKGSKPIGSSVGNWEGSGKVELDHEEFGLLLAWVKTQGKESPLDLAPFPISITYEPEGGTVQSRTLKGCDITKIDEAAKQGDTELKVTLELKIHGGIDRE